MRISQEQMEKILVFVIAVVKYAECSQGTSSCGEKFSTRKDQNIFSKHRLKSRVVESKPISRPLECYINCMKNCRCVSYNICNRGKLCELNSQKKDDDISLYDASDECDYHEYVFSKSQQSSACGDPCCSFLPPCENGGRCEASCMKNGRRFQCTCPAGYTGDRCERKAFNCRDHHVPSNLADGIRLVHGPNDTLYPVFCNFYSWSAQTLVQSHSRANYPDFHGWPMTRDHPISENAPNFLKYRLSLSKMQALRTQAAYWQVTCSFEKRTFDAQNMLRGEFSNFDPLTFQSGISCPNVPYVRIKGAGCDFCKVTVSQGSSTVNMKKDQYSYCSNAVNVVPSFTCSSGQIPAYFGNYNMGCFDEDFPCTSSDDDTTNVWFMHIVQ